MEIRNYKYKVLFFIIRTNIILRKREINVALSQFYYLFQKLILIIITSRLIVQIEL